MNLVSEFRQSGILQQQLSKLRQIVTRRWVIMDVCGGQTHAFLRYGLEAAVDDVLELVHGPGCPVCVTPMEVIDEAISLVVNQKVALATFGDMLRVPGSCGSLQQARAQGGNVRMVYSPLDAVEWALREPSRQVVFLGVGFETTAPATALAILQARQLGLTNFSLLSHHVRVEPGMRAILDDPECRVEGFLAAGHVCTVTGYGHYQELVEKYRVPIVVTGFEPVDLLAGLTACVDLLEQQRPALRNAYERSARPDGNREAQRLIDTVFETDDLPWRGFGTIPQGGLTMRRQFQQFDARQRFSTTSPVNGPDCGCRSAEVLSGRLKPPQCALFGGACTPDRPLGAPMVSSEGACAAYFLYGLRDGESSE